MRVHGQTWRVEAALEQTITEEEYHILDWAERRSTVLPKGSVCPTIYLRGKAGGQNMV